MPSNDFLFHPFKYIMMEGISYVMILGSFIAIATVGSENHKDYY